MIRAVTLLFFVALLYGCGEKAAEAPAAEAPAAEAPAAGASTAGASTAGAPTAEASTAEASTAEASTAEASTAEASTEGASTEGAPAAEGLTTAAPSAEDSPTVETPSPSKAVSVPAASGQKTDELNFYEVKVSATEKIRLSADKNVPSSGLMAVWIGQPKFEPKTLSGMQSASGVLQTSSPAASAKVIPSFPDDPSAFKVAPETSRCQVIDPTGTEVPFTITPTKLGKFRIGASVELYNQLGCKGDMLTKTANPVTVEVHSYIPWWQWVIETLWSFIKEIVAALLAILLIVFRKKLGNLFGIKEKT